jgi:NAD(P)-dependent dehydrogenase (short-subunit alcohol dehydrogenase family)
MRPRSCNFEYDEEHGRSGDQAGCQGKCCRAGPVWTPLIPSTMPTEKVKTFGANTGFGRPAQPIELAKIFMVLASDDASYVTGEVYAATGGQTPY